MIAELVTITDAAERLHLAPRNVAERIAATHTPAAGVTDDGRALLYTTAAIERITTP